MKQLSTSSQQLISILNDGQYHSGNALGKQLNITRAAVWKMIKQFNDYGLGITANKDKGYCLSQPLILLNEQQIKHAIHHADYHTQIQLFASLTSSNDYLKQHGQAIRLEHNDTNVVPVCLTEQQTAGKGRLNRQWFSPFGANIYCSVLWQFNKDLSELAGLSLITSLAIVRTLKALNITQDAMIKWPNDVLWQGKKLAGVLIEIAAEANGSCKAIIGIGINVNMPPSANQYIDQPWVAVNTILGNHYNRNKFTGTLIQQLFETITIFSQHGLSVFNDEWQQVDYLAGKTISIRNGNHTITGQSLGIDEKGYLRLQHDNHTIKSYSSGDVSIAKTRI